jgi:TPR repeat protein
LTFCYRDGKGIEPDHALAFQWFSRSAEQWDLQAQYHLAMCYGAGVGTSKDNVEAYKWATLAADHGYTNAALVATILKEKGGITTAQIEEATKRAGVFTKTNRLTLPAVKQPDIILPYPNRFGSK